MKVRDCATFDAGKAGLVTVLLLDGELPRAKHATVWCDGAAYPSVEVMGKDHRDSIVVRGKCDLSGKEVSFS